LYPITEHEEKHEATVVVGRIEIAVTQMPAAEPAAEETTLAATAMTRKRTGILRNRVLAQAAIGTLLL